MSATVDVTKGAKNQALFREVNERVGEALSSSPTANTEFLCECADKGCIETISLSVVEYEAVRANPTHFPIKRGHDVPALERVVEETERYCVVEKFGDAGRIAEKLDPRSRGEGAERE